MASPVKPGDLCSLVPTVSTDPCEAFRRIFFSIPKLICDFLSWMLNADGTVKQSWISEMGFIPVGVVLPYGGYNPPAGYLIADGSAVSRSIYAALFAVYGTTYGVGDGTSTFNLPNLVQRVPVGVDKTTADYALGATGGAAEVTLTIQESGVDKHRHETGLFVGGFDNNDWRGIIPRPGTPADFPEMTATPQATGEWVREVRGDGSDRETSIVGANSYMTITSEPIGATSTPVAHENRQPFISLNYIVKY